MSETKSRREFLVLTVTVSAALAVGACSGGGDDDDDGATTPTASPTPAGVCTVAIVSNHGHVLVVTAAQLAAAADVTYDIDGTSGHPHTFTLTAANFTTLQSGNPVAKTSVGGTHSHSVTVSACS